MTRTVEFWDNLDFKDDVRTPPDHREVVFRIGDEVNVTLDLTEAHLRELIAHNARYIEAADPAPPAEVAKVAKAAAGRTRSPAAGTGRGNPAARARAREIRHFADALGRSSEYIRPGWTPDQGLKNKYLDMEGTPLAADYDAWVAQGRPPLAEWQLRAS